MSIWVCTALELKFPEIIYYMNYRSYIIEMKKQVLIIGKYDRYFFRTKLKSESVNELGCFLMFP